MPRLAPRTSDSTRKRQRRRFAPAVHTSDGRHSNLHQERQRKPRQKRRDKSAPIVRRRQQKDAVADAPSASTQKFSETRPVRASQCAAWLRLTWLGLHKQASANGQQRPAQPVRSNDTPEDSADPEVTASKSSPVQTAATRRKPRTPAAQRKRSFCRNSASTADIRTYKSPSCRSSAFGERAIGSLDPPCPTDGRPNAAEYVALRLVDQGNSDQHVLFATCYKHLRYAIEVRARDKRAPWSLRRFSDIAAQFGHDKPPLCDHNADRADNLGLEVRNSILIHRARAASAWVEH